MPEQLIPLFSNAWSIALVILFFGGSIFVHELGHFLAARWRGVHVSRFSIGFGPKIFSWTGKDGVEYRLSWLPLGGYVALPQLADMRGIEGEPGADVERLPPISYASKMIVFAAGAVFNIVFAVLLASVVWAIGWPVSNETATSRIGYVSPTLTLADGTVVPSPASQAGLKPGDLILSIDGTRLTDWHSVLQTLVTSAGRDASGNPQSIFRVRRDGAELDIVLLPRLATSESIRRVGISPAYELLVHQVAEGGTAAAMGLRTGDEIVSLDGIPMLNQLALQEHLAANRARPVAMQVKRDGATLALSVPARAAAAAEPTLGITFTTGSHLSHPTPFAQIGDNVRMTFRTLWSLVHPRSDIGLSKMSGPVGIAHVFYDAAEAGIRYVLWFTILINVSLAIFNLLPIPVLDGGHMLFATIGKLRGRTLQGGPIMATQQVFMILLLSMIVYVTFFDIRRLRDVPEAAPAAAPAK